MNTDSTNIIEQKKHARKKKIIAEQCEFYTQTSRQLAAESGHFGKIIQEAKTNTKRRIFKKKLNKNNKLLADCLINLEKYQQLKDAVDNQ